MYPKFKTWIAEAIMLVYKNSLVLYKIEMNSISDKV